MRVRGRLLTLGLLAALACVAPAALPAPAAAAAKVQSLRGTDGANVAIRRTAHGIPHILGASFRDLAYGYGYAFAQDNICTIASSYVTVRAERSRFFGPDNSWKFEGNGSTVNNLNSDFFFKRIIDTGVVEKLKAQKPPNGPRPEIASGVNGYVAGYNRYLRDTGVANLPDPTCRGKEWVRPIREIDVYRYFYKLALLASSGVAIDGIASAQPPTPPAPVGGAITTERQMELIEGNLDRFRLGDAGSNAYGLGSQATADGHGMVLGNPHFPWQGSQRFYQSHLTVPGKADVAGASLFGVPIVLIGHTQRFAWSHTVSTARRFTPFELKLVPGSPTTYLYDGQPRQMTADRVTVQVPVGRQAAGPHPHALFVGARAGVHLDPRAAAVPVDLHDGPRDGRHQRGQLPLPQPLLRDEHGADRARVRPGGAAQPGDPVGELDRGGLHGRGLLRGHRGGAQRAELQGPGVQHGAGHPDHPAARHTDPRRVAHRVQVGQRPGRAAARRLRPEEHAVAVPARLRDELERQLLAVQPGAAAGGLRAHHRRRAHHPQPAHEARA